MPIFVVYSFTFITFRLRLVRAYDLRLVVYENPCPRHGEETFTKGSLRAPESLDELQIPAHDLRGRPPVVSIGLVGGSRAP